MVRYKCGRPSCGKVFDTLEEAMIHVIREHGFGSIFSIDEEKDSDGDLIDKLGDSYLKKQCAKCGSKDIAFFFEGTIARDVNITDEDIVAKFKVKELFLNSKFYLCKECAKEFAKLVEEFFEEVDSDD